MTGRGSKSPRFTTGVQIRCRIGWHDWSQYRHTETIDIYGDGFGGMTTYPTSMKRIYERRCDSCGLPQIKKVKQ